MGSRASATASDGATRRFTAEEVLRMVDVGILHEDEPLELLDGELVVVSPQGPTHRCLTTRLRERLVRAYGAGAWVQEEKPLAVSAYDLPEPDVAVIAGDVRDYRDRHPTGAEALLVVEVAITSQSHDRRKLPLYARGDVTEVWVLDAATERLEVYRDPQPEGRYADVRVLEATDEVVPPGTTECWSVAELLYD